MLSPDFSPLDSAVYRRAGRTHGPCCQIGSDLPPNLATLAAVLPDCVGYLALSAASVARLGGRSGPIWQHCAQTHGGHVIGSLSSATVQSDNNIYYLSIIILTACQIKTNFLIKKILLRYSSLTSPDKFDTLICKELIKHELPDASLVPRRNAITTHKLCFNLFAMNVPFDMFDMVVELHNSYKKKH